MDLSMGVPSLAVSRYFLSQMSRDASWKETASMSLGSIFTTVFMNPRRSDVVRPSNGSQDDWTSRGHRKKRTLECLGSRGQTPEPPRFLILGCVAQTQD